MSILRDKRKEMEDKSTIQMKKWMNLVFKVVLSVKIIYFTTNPELRYLLRQQIRF